MVSPLLSPLTFQGALDDHFGINCCYMEMPSDTKSTAAASTDTPAASPPPTVLILGPEIEVFAQAKDLHFAQVSEFVRAKLQVRFSYCVKLFFESSFGDTDLFQVYYERFVYYIGARRHQEIQS